MPLSKPIDGASTRTGSIAPSHAVPDETQKERIERVSLNLAAWRVEAMRLNGGGHQSGNKSRQLHGGRASQVPDLGFDICSRELADLPSKVLRREEVDRLGSSHRLDVPFLETEEPDSGNQLALKLGIIEIA